METCAHDLLGVATILVCRHDRGQFLGVNLVLISAPRSIFAALLQRHDGTRAAGNPYNSHAGSWRKHRNPSLTYFETLRACPFAIARHAEDGRLVDIARGDKTVDRMSVPNIEAKRGRRWFSLPGINVCYEKNAIS